MLSVCGVGGKFLTAAHSFYGYSMARVSVGMVVSESFSVDGGLRQGCVMALWLFSVYMDGVVNAMVLWKGLD